MSRARPARRRGFTLVEMLVVLGIIAVLAALLLPAVMAAVGRARNAAIALEVNQLASAIEAYKQDKGDYPPNFRNPDVVLRHIRKCYPKIDPTYLTAFMAKATPVAGSTITFIDEGESLVFWLAMTDTNPRYPFLSYMQPLNVTTPIAASPKKYYAFDETRLFSTVADGVPSYKAKYCKETFYIYIDSRAYNDVAKFQVLGDPSPPGDTYAFADDTSVGVRPYWSDIKSTGPSSTTTSGTTVLNRNLFKSMNPTTFQIICAGQDGEFGMVTSASGSTPDPDVKQFPSGTYYTAGDKDNITNFSNGRRLVDNMP